MAVAMQGEVGRDLGGLLRDWFSNVTVEMVNPCDGLFEYGASDNATIQVTLENKCIERDNSEMNLLKFHA